MSKYVTVSVDVNLSEIDDYDLIGEVESRGYTVAEVVDKEDAESEVKESLIAIYEAMQADPLLAWKRMAAMVEAYTGRIVTREIK